MYSVKPLYRWCSERGKFESYEEGLSGVKECRKSATFVRGWQWSSCTLQKIWSGCLRECARGEETEDQFEQELSHEVQHIRGMRTAQNREELEEAREFKYSRSTADESISEPRLEWGDRDLFVRIEAKLRPLRLVTSVEWWSCGWPWRRRTGGVKEIFELRGLSFRRVKGKLGIGVAEKWESDHMFEKGWGAVNMSAIIIIIIIIIMV